MYTALFTTFWHFRRLLGLLLKYLNKFCRGQPGCCRCCGLFQSSGVDQDICATPATCASRIVSQNDLPTVATMHARIHVALLDGVQYRHPGLGLHERACERIQQSANDPFGGFALEHKNAAAGSDEVDRLHGCATGRTDFGARSFCFFRHAGSFGISIWPGQARK